jgi:hypothetical protein
MVLNLDGSERNINEPKFVISFHLLFKRLHREKLKIKLGKNLEGILTSDFMRNN